MKMLARAFLICFLFCAEVHAASKPIFSVSLEDKPAAGRILYVEFYDKIPAPEIVDKILRETLEHAIAIDASKDILATALKGDDELSSNQYSGSLSYDAKEKKILNMDELFDAKTTASETPDYYVEIAEEHTMEGITPPNSWLDITIVFSKMPSQDEAYQAIITEADKNAGRGLDMSLYVSIGNKNVETSWKQMKDKDGTYVTADFTISDKKLVHQETMLKQY